MSSTFCPVLGKFKMNFSAKYMILEIAITFKVSLSGKI